MGYADNIDQLVVGTKKASRRDLNRPAGVDKAGGEAGTSSRSNTTIPIWETSEIAYLPGCLVDVSSIT